MGINIKNLTFAYGEKAVLKGINLHFKKGKFTALMGENGSGKTTLIKNILGSLVGDSGEITVDDVPIRTLGFKKLSQRIGYIPQISDGQFNFYNMDVVLFGLAGEISLLRTPGPKEIQRGEEMFRNLRMEHLMYRKFNEVSGGERQMVLVARALIKDSPYIIMDEPTSSLDYSNQLKIMEVASALAKQGKTVIMSTHNPSFALHYADEVAMLKFGRLQCAGPTEDVMTKENLETLYNRSIELIEVDGKRVIYP